MTHRKTSLLTTLILSTVGLVLSVNSAEAQRRFQLGGPFGIGIGGGQGLTIGGGYGVQLGGGQGLRFGPPNVGVQYGGGQGARFGTPNLGVQYGGGQLLRYGTPNRGIRVGGGEGVRVGTPQSGLQFGSGNGLQVGQFATPTQPYAAQYPATVQPQPLQPSYDQSIQQPYDQTIYSQPAYQPIETFPAPTASSGIQDSPTLAAPGAATNSGFIPSTNTTLPAVPQNQFDAARQSLGEPSALPIVTPSTIVPATPSTSDSDSGVSVLQLD